MAFFNIGDRVTIRRDICSGKCYKMQEGSRNGVVANHVCEYAGKTVVISDIKLEFPSYYRITEGLAAADEMFQEYLDYIDGTNYDPPTASELMSLLSCG